MDKGIGAVKQEKKEDGKSELIKAIEHRTGSQWALSENCTIFYEWLAHSKENSITSSHTIQYDSGSMSINWFSSFLNWFRFRISFSSKKIFSYFEVLQIEKLHRHFPDVESIVENRKIVTKFSAIYIYNTQ